MGASGGYAVTEESNRKETKTMGLKLSDSQVSLIRIAFCIARDRFESHAQSVCLADVAATFRKQAEELTEIESHLVCEECDGANRSLICLSCH